MYDIEELIQYHNESEFLDFKQEEYNEQNKPNLIKDILALSNAFIEGDRYIIIGVKKKDGVSEFFDINSKLDSANIQQYVHDNITPELDIEYVPYTHRGYNLFIIRIKDPSDQPYMTSKPVQFKNGAILLKANECWIRKGSYQITAARKDFEKIYAKRADLKVTKSVEVSFLDGTFVMNASPKFIKKVTHYKKKGAATLEQYVTGMDGILGQTYTFSGSVNSKYNKSYVQFNLLIRNSGTYPIEDYKLTFEFDGKVQDLAKTNIVYNRGAILPVVSNAMRQVPTTYLNTDLMRGELIPKHPILVGDDVFVSENIYLKPSEIETQITVKWKLISRDFKQSGDLIINLDPVIEVTANTKYIDKDKEEKTVTSNVEDYLATE